MYRNFNTSLLAFFSKELCVPCNLLLISRETGPKKQWQPKNRRLLKVFGKWHREQIKCIIAARSLGKGVVAVSDTLVQNCASGRRHLPLRTFTKYTPTSAPINVQWRYSFGLKLVVGERLLRSRRRKCGPNSSRSLLFSSVHGLAPTRAGVSPLSLYFPESID